MTAALQRVVVVNDISVAKGGATGLAMASALAFRRRGLAVTYLTGDAGDAPELAAAGVEIVGLGRARLLAAGAGRALVDGLYNRAAERMVADWIARNDAPGVVYHLHGWSQILSPSVFAALRPVADRLALSAHDFFLSCPNGAYALLKQGDLCTLKPMSLACVATDCDRRHYAHKLWRVARQGVRQAVFDFGRLQPPVLAIHAAMAGPLALGGVPAGSIQTLPNPVSPFTSERVEAEANRELLFVGRLEDGKGPDLAAAAAREAGVPLRVVGEGPMMEGLKAAYPEVAFEGRLPPEKIGALARQARALVMPSRYPEPFGLVAAEALWSGLPVVAAHTAFLAGDIVKAEAGLAVDVRDPAAFATALARLAADDAGVRRMSLNAFNRTGHVGLPFDSWIDRLLAVYEGRLAASITSSSRRALSDQR